MTKPVIGFVGLGLMGTGIVKRLLASGYTVIGLDIDPEREAQARAFGATTADSLAQLAAEADIIHTCVSTPTAVAEIADGPGGLTSLAEMRTRILVDHSTTDIPTTRRIAAAIAEKSGLAFIDAPVSGGPAAAEGGTLAIMAGGDAEAIAEVRPVMETVGRFTHMGPTTAGQATKLVNQTLVLTNYCVIAEALRLAEAYGVDAAKIPHALETGHAGSNLLPILFERMIARDWTPLGHARTVLKDLEMLSEAARQEHIPMPLSGQALSLFRMLVSQGMSERDGSSVFTLLEDSATPRT
jgi:3-hydroxyisobutyrate dehydrogenase-like beta-hydroxyacid dehydrogenase